MMYGGFGLPNAPDVVGELGSSFFNFSWAIALFSHPQWMGTRLDGMIVLQNQQPIFDKTWTQAARKNWKIITKSLHDYLRLDNLVSGPLDLVIPKQVQQTRAENQI
jgi:hypothetical protein